MLLIRLNFLLIILSKTAQLILLFSCITIFLNVGLHIINLREVVTHVAPVYTINLQIIFDFRMGKLLNLKSSLTRNKYFVVFIYTPKIQITASIKLI